MRLDQTQADGPTTGFSDVLDPNVMLTAPQGSGQLPEVSFGGVLDTVAGLIKDVSGWDLRADVTDWIAGDVGLVQPTRTPGAVWPLR